MRREDELLFLILFLFVFMVFASIDATVCEVL